MSNTDHNRFQNDCDIVPNAVLVLSPAASADRCQGGYDAVANIRGELFFFRGMMVDLHYHLTVFLKKSVFLIRAAFIC